jgi:hypothetical protein
VLKVALLHVNVKFESWNPSISSLVRAEKSLSSTFVFVGRDVLQIANFLASKFFKLTANSQGIMDFVLHVLVDGI